jgi:hypothetical protein
MLNKEVMDQIAAFAFSSRGNNDLLPEVLAGLVMRCIAVRVQHTHTHTHICFDVPHATNYAFTFPQIQFCATATLSISRKWSDYFPKALEALQSNEFQPKQLVELAVRAAAQWETNKPQRVPSKKNKHARSTQPGNFDTKRQKQVASSCDLLRWALN